MGTNLRDKQIGALKQMLNLNHSITKQNASEPMWKILVYDRAGQDILTPLLSVQEIRQCGVTLHILLHTERENIPDVPCIYFCVPSEDNVDRICRDLQSQLYGSYYLNFITPIPRQRIEDLANSAYQCDAGKSIQKVFDQYLNFISVESDFFVLKHQDSDRISFYSLNRGDVKDSEMEGIIDTIVDSLFSVFTTLGVVPIIRSPRGNAAENVAEKLDKKIRDNLRDPRQSLFNADPHSSSQYSFQRPLLLIFDRGMDLATPLHHTWTYQALSHDVLDLNLNQIKFSEPDEIPLPPEASTSTSSRMGNKGKMKSYELDDRKDYFWGQYKGCPFPQVAEAIQTELEEYRKAEDEMKRLKTTMGLDGGSIMELEIGADMLNDNTARLTSAITNLPQLLEKKKILDAHTSIATSILKHIKDRKLDSYFELESKLIGRQALERSSVLDILLDPDMGTENDKMRFFLIYYLMMQQSMPASELDQFISALESAGCDLKPINFVKKWISYTKMASANSTTSYSQNVKSSSMLSKLALGSSFLMEGVRNFVVKRQNLPLTRLVEELMDGKLTPETEDFRYFDPKLLKPATGQAPKGNGYQEAIVFVVGGGNYIEYQNLIDFAKAKSQAGAFKKVIYGCSTLTNANQFMRQLSSLGEEMR